MAVVDGTYCFSCRDESGPPTNYYCWIDDFGNQIMPIFTTLEESSQFMEGLDGDYMGNGFGPLDMLDVLIKQSRAGVAFFALDPPDRKNFLPLQLHELINRLVWLAYEAGKQGIEPWHGQQDRTTD